MDYLGYILQRSLAASIGQHQLSHRAGSIWKESCEVFYSPSWSFPPSRIFDTARCRLKVSSASFSYNHLYSKWDAKLRADKAPLQLCGFCFLQSVMIWSTKPPRSCSASIGSFHLRQVFLFWVPQPHSWCIQSSYSHTIGCTLVKCSLSFDGFMDSFFSVFRQITHCGIWTPFLTRNRNPWRGNLSLYSFLTFGYTNLQY